MKQILLIISVVFTEFTFAQDINILLKEADNFDKQLKEVDALNKYKEILSLDTNNYRAIYRLTEIYAAQGARHKVIKQGLPFYDTANTYLNKAIEVDSANADTYYLMALMSRRMADAVKDRESAEHLRNMKNYTERVVALNPNHAKGWMLLGKWHLDVARATFFAKAAAKTIYGGLPKASIDAAIENLEKAIKIEPYFIEAHFELAKAYEANNQPALQIEVLKKLIKLPLRTPDDAAWKDGAKKMLEQMN